MEGEGNIQLELLQLSGLNKYSWVMRSLVEANGVAQGRNVCTKTNEEHTAQ